MICVELFCGTKSFSKVAQSLGHKTFTMDINPQFKPDLCVDIMDFDVSMLPAEFRHPDIVWASPPCTTFSVASLRHYWVEGKPKNERCLQGIAIVKKTLSLVEQLLPRFFFVENPRGMLRKQQFMQHLPRKTITYCQYGDFRMKPTDIWTNTAWSPRPACKNGNPCHQSARRGADRGTQNMANAKARSVIPPTLFQEIFSQLPKTMEVTTPL